MSLLAATSRHLDRLDLAPPAVLVDERRARANLAAMAARAAASDVGFRPHFKTHDNVGVGRWFREAGVRRITVSSLAMAERFARDGWVDQTVAVLVDPRELPRLGDLAGRLAARGGALGLVVDTPEVARAARAAAGQGLLLWLKVDTGYGRSGAHWDDATRLRAVAHAAPLRGLLTHAGHSYRTPLAELPALFTETAQRLAAAREAIGDAALLLSVGDTPTCATVGRFAGVDEVRPGNFLFFDLMQRQAGVCGDRDVALALACGVIGLDAAGGRIVLHAGAVHLAKEAVATPAGPVYGCLATATADGLDGLVPEAAVTGLTQEHAVVTLPPGRWDELASGLSPGDRVLVVPAHSCLTCHQHGAFMTFAGEGLPRDVVA